MEDGKTGSGFTDFDSGVIAFLEQRGYSRENYMVSPLSFRAALALAAAGAGGETEEALLRAMGFSTPEEAAEWYGFLLEAVEDFRMRLEQERQRQLQHPEAYGGGEPDRAFSIVNSLWHNADEEGAFSEEYVRYVSERFAALAAEVPGAELAGAVNRWVDEETHGMIPSIADDLSDMAAVLVNALYLRTSWQYPFETYNTHPGNFTTLEGDTAQKDYMTGREDYLYYEDGDTQLVGLPMKGAVMAVFVLGDTSDISRKIAAAQWEEVVVTLPKIEIETSLSEGELADYLRAQGAGTAFTEDADFSVMCPDVPWHIQDIIQKTRLKMDEDGIEAAAVTALFLAGSAFVEPKEPKEFTADRPFSFYIYSQYADRPELLFYGQCVR